MTFDTKIKASKIAIKKGIRSADNLRYDVHHWRLAKDVLKSLEGDGCHVNTAVRRLCSEYAIDVLGSRWYAPWLIVYSALSGTFREGWIPDNYYRNIVSPTINGTVGQVAALKNLSVRVVGGETVWPDCAIKVNGGYFALDGRKIELSDLEGVFLHYEKAVFKSNESSQGKGIHIFGSFDEFRRQAIRLPDGVLQRFVHQHSELDSFTSESVCTLRLTSVRDGSGRISIRSGYLRLGAPSDLYVKSGSAMRIPVDCANGQLSDVGFHSNWRRSTHYFDRGREFLGFNVPLFEQCKETVLRLHSGISFAGCIGWDVVPDRDGQIWALEWNAIHNDIKFSEATQGPCFSDLGWENFGKSHRPGGDECAY